MPELISSSDLWSELNDELKAFIQSRIGASSDAEDLLQEVFIKVHLKLETLKDPAKAKNWVYQITRNQIHEYFRNLGKDVEFDSKLEFPDPSNSEILEDPFCCINTFLEDLPESYSVVMKKRILEGKKQQQIAAELEISLHNVKARIYRSKELLKGKFSSCCGYSINEKGLLVGEQNCRNVECNDYSLNKN